MTFTLLSHAAQSNIEKERLKVFGFCLLDLCGRLSEILLQHLFACAVNLDVRDSFRTA